MRNLKNTISLKKKFDFKKTLNYGRYAAGEYISVYVLKRKSTEDQEQNLFGICVSKKHGNSVIRNKLKRWVREAYKEIEPKINKGYKIIVLYKKNIVVNNISFHVLKNELDECLKEAELYINE